MSTEERQGGPPSEPTVVYVQNVPAAQVGDHNVQYISNYNYGPGIWTDNLWDVATKQARAIMRVDNSLSTCAWLGVDALAVGGSAGLYLFGFLASIGPACL